MTRRQPSWYAFLKSARFTYEDIRAKPPQPEVAAEIVGRLFTGEAIKTGKVADAMGINRPAATGHLRKAEAQGLVARIGQAGGWCPADAERPLSAVEEAVAAVEAMYAGKPITVEDVADDMGLSLAAANSRLRKAGRRGLIDQRIVEGRTVWRPKRRKK